MKEEKLWFLLFLLTLSEKHVQAYGIWSQWSHWSACSKTCNIGLTMRYRNCTYQNHDGCKGSDMKKKKCLRTICPRDKRPCKEPVEPKNGRLHRLTSFLYMYSCNPGYQLGDVYFRSCASGKWIPESDAICKDKNECLLTATDFPCHEFADCINTVGSFECVCRPGFTGDGRQCRREKINLNDFLGQDSMCGHVRKQNDTRKRIRRIVGGRFSNPGDWPWMALITVNGGHLPLFGGVLIKTGWVLTVASLLHMDGGLVNEERIIVSLGENDRNKPENEEQQFRIQSGGIYVHPKFDRKRLLNDIALLKLDGNAKITDYVNTICLLHLKQARKYERHHHLASIAGWGLIKPFALRRTLPKQRDIFSGVLQDVTLPIVDSYRCKKQTAYHFCRKTMLCAGTLDNHGSPCIGDGGSPLAIQNPQTKRWALLGLYSWSEGCAQPSKYSYYTRVAKFRRWINEITHYSNN